MGIRFYCPNGHKLHVKAFLAGKRGICPHCQARCRIPDESQIPAGAPKVRGNSSADIAERDHRAGPATPVHAESPEFAPVGTDPELIPRSPADETVWYVRPPTGGQFGPAPGDVFRGWIAEGRVSPDSLVWRDGWPDWRMADDVFSELENPAEIGDSIGDPFPRSDEPIDLPAETANVLADPNIKARRRVRARRKSLTAIVFLGLTTVVLLAVLMLVLQRTS